ncbi:MAG: peptidase [Flavipsychrobacter sp.]|nr:peptidase [Flavipsychrobacter sp.]
MPTFDKPNERFTTQVEITAPDSFKTLSNGYLLSQVRAGVGLRTDTWIMEKPIQPYAVMMAMGNYAIVEDDKWRGREVSYYVEPEYERYARLMFKNTPEMMEYFSTITGVPYPWNKYSQVVVRDYVSGAMENTTATVFGEFMNQNAREIADKDHEDIVSHELFHQWFGDYVTAESWSHLTVNESFATYGEQLWRRHKYGDASADELAHDDLVKYLLSARQSEPPLVRHRYSTQEEMFDLISYQKGGAILKYMHGLMGDSAFSKAMKIYLTQNALKPAEATHWRLAVEEATGQDWNWFFKQWYNRGGFPMLNVKYDYDDAAKELQVTIEQKQDSSFVLPVKAEVLYGNEKSVVDWDINRREVVFTYPYKNGMRPVVIPDSRNWLVGRMADNKQPGEFKAQFLHSQDNYLNRYRAVAAASRLLTDSNAQAVFTMALTDKEAGIREQVSRYLARQSTKKLQDKWRQQVAMMAVNDGAARVRAAAFDVLSAWKVEGSKPDMLAALADSSYNVAGAALNGLNKLKDDTAYALSKAVLQTDPKARLLFTALEIIGEKGNAADVELYTGRAPYLYGTNKIGFAHAMTTYIKNVRDVAAFEKALPVYVQLVNSESIGSYRFAMGSFFFEAAREYKERVQEARKNVEKDEARQKLDIMKEYAEQILAGEKEKDYQRQYKSAMKVFGS